MTPWSPLRVVIAAGALSALVAPAPVSAQLNYIFDALVRHPLNEERLPMPDMYYDDQFIELFDSLERVGVGQTCQTAQQQILAQLNQMRADDSPLLEGYSYGPVWIDSPSNNGHFAIVVYPTREGAETFEEAVRDGVVIEQTNYISADTGMYLTRPWEDWEENWAGVGLIDRGYQPDYYWDEDESYPVPACDEDDPDCTEKGGGGDANPDDAHPAPEEEATLDGSSETSRDPNEKVGTAGVGAARWVAADERLHYVVYFENVGTAPAQVVTIADGVDPAEIDPSSVTLEAVTVGAHRLEIPDGSSAWSVLLDLRPAQPLLLRIDAVFAPATGALTWTFRSLDPATWELPEFDGFLPPNDVPPAGEGSVAYSFRPAVGAASGTTIGAGKVARIVFDENAPIETGDWMNTIDATPPESAVAALPAVQANGRFAVAWAASDAASGVGTVMLESTEDDGPWARWLPNAPASPVAYWGNARRRYGFRSVARDRVGNRETEPALADAITEVAALDDATGYQAAEYDGKSDQLPSDCHLTLDDPLFDGAENYAVSKVQRLLLPADDDGLGVARPDANFVAYRIKPARQGVRPPTGKCSREAITAKQPCTADADCLGGACLARKFVAGAKHRPRGAVRVDNRLGELLLDTKKEQLLLVPATLDRDAPPMAPAAARDHMKCYQVNLTKGVDSEQAPGGKLRTGMQTLVLDAFGDGLPRLFDLTKATLLCTPSAKANVDTLEADAAGAHRSTRCEIAPAAIGSPVDALVCYQAKLARTVVDAGAAGRLGVPVGTRLTPPQPPHASQAAFVGHQLPNPARVATKKEAVVCVASELLRPGS